MAAVSGRVAAQPRGSAAAWWPVVALAGGWAVFAGPVGPGAPDPVGDVGLLRVVTAAGAAVFLAGAGLRLSRVVSVQRRVLAEGAGRWLAVFTGLTLSAWLLGVGDLVVAAVVGAALAAPDPTYPALSRRSAAIQGMVAGEGPGQPLVGVVSSVLTVAVLVAVAAPVPAVAGPVTAAAAAALLGAGLGGGLGWALRYGRAHPDQADVLVVGLALAAYGLGAKVAGIGLLAAVGAGVVFGLAAPRREAGAAEERPYLQWFFVVAVLVTLGGVAAGAHPIRHELALPLVVLAFLLPVVVTAAWRLAWAGAGLGRVTATAGPGVVSLYLLVLAVAGGFSLPPAAWATVVAAAALAVFARSAAAAWATSAGLRADGAQ